MLSFHNLFRAPNDFLTKTLYLHNVYPICGACLVHCTSFTLQYYLHDCINYKVSCYVISSSISIINPLSSKQFLERCLSDSWNSCSPWKVKNCVARPYRNCKNYSFPLFSIRNVAKITRSCLVVSFVGVWNDFCLMRLCRMILVAWLRT
jgi:hypothetical protein